LVAAVDEHDEYSFDDPGGHILWRGVILENGTTGWTPGCFLLDREALSALAEVEATAGLSDAAALLAAAQAFIDNAAKGELGYQARYSRSPDERHLVLATGDHLAHTGFQLTVRQGCHRLSPLHKYGELGLWQDGSRYWADTSVGNLGVYDCRTLEAICVVDMWWASLRIPGKRPDTAPAGRDARR